MTVFFAVQALSALGLAVSAAAQAPPVSRAAGTTISTAQAEITTSAAGAAVAPGDRLTVRVDVVPARGIHVYAPGAAGYRVVALKLQPQPHVRLEPINYPPSEIYFFEPLNERVRVYQKPFSVVQAAVLEGSARAQAALRGQDTVTLSGTFEYQACDDTVCFIPVSVPVSWTVPLRARPAPSPK